MYIYIYIYVYITHVTCGTMVGGGQADCAGEGRQEAGQLRRHRGCAGGRDEWPLLCAP